MTGHYSTTPFGGGRITAAIFQNHQTLDRQRAALKQSRKEDSCVEKWQLIRDLSEARSVFNLSDRTIAVLDSLLSFHQQRELDGTKPIIVFPSNAELSLRSRGMADATLRRHIAALVDAQLIQRRDSPNGKRYCRRNGQGAIESAYGFDLSPLVLAAPKIRQAAKQIRDEARLCQDLRSEITLLSRDICKLLESAQTEALAGNWLAFDETYQPLTVRLSRRAASEDLKIRRDALKTLLIEVETTYQTSLESQKVSASDADFERHYQNTKPESQYNKTVEIFPELKEKSDFSNRILDFEEETKVEKTSSSDKEQFVPLSYLVKICPNIGLYSKSGISNWLDLLKTSDLVRQMLGISDQTWRMSCQFLGNMTASIVIAAILERVETIRSPGAYLRTLSMQAKEGKFQLQPMLTALEKA